MVRETAILWNTSFRDPGRKRAEKGRKGAEKGDADHFS
jgi:hypothetical protein